jgi:hypothetical protein
VAVIAAIYWKHWRQLVPPMAAILILFVAISPVRHARQSSFYYGAATLSQSFQVLAAESLAHNDGLGGLNRETAWKPWWRDVAILVCATIALASSRRPAAITIIGAWCLLFVAHHTTGLLYPADRTGLYFLPLAGLVLAAQRSRLAIVFALLVAIEYAVQLNWTHFYVWQYDADNRAIMRIVAEKRPARLGISWPLQPSLSYYRERMHLTSLAPLTRDGPDGDYEYYVLTEADQDRIQRYGLQVIYRGPVSGTVLARRS